MPSHIAHVNFTLIILIHIWIEGMSGPLEGNGSGGLLVEGECCDGT